MIIIIIQSYNTSRFGYDKLLQETTINFDYALAGSFETFSICKLKQLA